MSERERIHIYIYIYIIMLEREREKVILKSISSLTKLSKKEIQQPKEVL